MKAPYTCVYREIWDDPKFWTMEPMSKLTFFYLMTTPMGNGIGCFKAGFAAMIEESRLDFETFSITFKDCCDKGLVEYDDYARVVYLPNYFLRNLPANPNGIVALSKDYVRVPNSPLKVKCYEMIREWCKNKKTKKVEFLPTFIETFGENPPTLPVTLPVTSQEGLGEQPGIYSPSPSPSDPDPNTVLPNGNKKEKSKPKKKAADYPPDFVLFWEAYPNKVGKGEAGKAWKSARKSGLLPPADKLIEILGEQVSSREHNASVGVFVPPWPNPSTWLNQRRWEDEPSAAPAQPAKPKTQMQKNLDFLDRYLDGDDPLKVSGKTEVVR